MSEILFISADPESRAGALRALEDEGIFAKIVENWDLARVMLADRQVDLVIVDRTTTPLPVTDLVAALPAVDPREVDIPVILLGSNTAWELRARELRAGASDFIDLPFEPQELGALIAARLRTKKRIDDLKSDALVDELTGVYNRRYLDAQVAVKLKEARRYGHPCSCALLDIDRFKSINDTWGHQVGDSVIRGVANLTRTLMRGEDLIARYGGEEFALVLNHTDARGSAILGKRILSAIESARFEPEVQELRVTISMGIATYPNDDVESVEELVRRADERLYRAKLGGRNQVVGLE